jgi:hypothetical protein
VSGQYSLFPGLDPSPPAQAHSPTSVAAAASVEGVPASTWRQKVYEYIDSQGYLGATDEEVQEALGMNPSTQRPRRVELVRFGVVRDSGVTRKTRSNRSAVVWVSRKGLEGGIGGR